MNGIPQIIMTDNGTANTRRLNLTPAQREELHRLTIYLGISLQQGYVRLRAGLISLSGQ